MDRSKEPQVTSTSRGDARREQIRQAAVEQFMQRGYRATSMAHIARAAGVSRPALYQYFSDKDDVLAAAFAKVFEERVDAALAALSGSDDPFERVDGMLQRFEGDLWELTWTSDHHVELLDAKSPLVMDAITGEVDRLWEAASAALNQMVPGRSAATKALREDWLDMLRWSPRGMKTDEPSVDTYRRRLTALARSLAAEIDRQSSDR